MFTGMLGFAQEQQPQPELQDTTEQEYKKRVLETSEVDFITSYYTQSGSNAAVTGGIGDEALTDFASAITVSIPLNDDDVLTIDGSVSAYTSASSSNIDPFDGSGEAEPYQASTGASSSDVWFNVTGNYSHSSDDRNKIWSTKLSVSNEFDYFSVGAGGSYTRLFNEKNTELSVNASLFFDTWRTIYPYELRPFGISGDGINDYLFSVKTITGNTNYNPAFTEHDKTNRNTYSVGVGFSQILSKTMQGSLMLDVVQQQGLLSTPFQRVYFKDVDDSFIENFHLAEDVERMPDTRLKIATGGRLNIYVSERIVIKTYYRYYSDDWGINSHTASIEIPIKITDKYTLYPTYRYYNQTAADYFAPYNEHLSTNEFYTSDYDLSEYNASQYGMGIKYTDVFTSFHISKFGLKEVYLKYNYYERNTGLSASIVSLGFKFIMD